MNDRDRLIAKAARKELAKYDFWEFCRLTRPKFYKKNRAYLREFCYQLQEFLEGDDDVLVINAPPRHGKSLTATQFVKWVFGLDVRKKIMTGSYNETLSTTFSKAVRNDIQEIKADENKIVYGDIFPATSVKQGDAAMNLWSLDGGHNNYLATSPTGTATGFGADLIIIDDLIKSAEEANNANVLDKHWEWFTNTMLSRLESCGKIILIMTRWHSLDLAGRALSEMPNTGYKVKHINIKALQDNGEMLCEEILSEIEYLRKTKTMGADIASANYQQEPIDIKGRLYGEFKTYTKLPTFKRIASYTDTADTGSDFLCCFIYGVTFDNEVYILDVVYTKEPMEVTEKLVAQAHIRNKVNEAIVESNNGGRGFARNFETEMKKLSATYKTVVKWFHQSQNKQARILSNSTWVMEHIYFPETWRNKWPELYDALIKYQREGKNKHDDAPDALTGVAEEMTKSRPKSKTLRLKGV